MTARDVVDSTHRTVLDVVVVGAAWLLLGLVGGVAAAAAVVWTTVGGGDRARVLALAALAALVTGVGWIVAGTPLAFEVVAFVDRAGRAWFDATGRAAVALLLTALVLPERPTTRVADEVVTRPRLPEVDRMRAVSIVAVVVIHGLPFRPPVTAYIDYWVGDLLRFSVATLVFLSGWLLPARGVGRSWVRRRLGRLLPPYLLASALVLAVAPVSPLVDERPALSALLLGDAIGPYYYVHVLVALTLVTPLLQRLEVRTQWTLLAAAGAGSLAIELADLPLYLHNHLTFTWLPWYLAGHLLRPHRDRLAQVSDTTRGLVLTTTAGLALTLGLLPIESPPRRLVTWLTMAAVLASLLLVGLRTPGSARPVTARLSNQSYLVYLYHPLVVAGVAGAFGSPFLTLRPVTAAVAAITVCLAAGALAREVWPDGARRWLGA